MKIVQVSIARIQLTDILEQLANDGEPVFITVHGDVVAKLVEPTRDELRRALSQQTESTGG
jgi:prevent-host-death family protein